VKVFCTYSSNRGCIIVVRTFWG